MYSELGDISAGIGIVELQVRLGRAGTQYLPIETLQRVQGRWPNSES